MNAMIRCTFSLGTAALLAACNGSQPPIGAPGAMPQSSAIARHARRGGSWMLPTAKSGDLLYLMTDTNFAYVLTYPAGKSAGKLTLSADNGTGVCSDSSGDVFVTAYNYQPTHGYLYEYAHGGTKPIATLDDGSYIPTSCAVDPTTGNLAVTNNAAVSSQTGNVATYVGARGSPTTYTDPGFKNYAATTFDDHGDLFIIGSGDSLFEFAELPQGGSTLINVTMSQQIYGGHIQWDGTNLAVTLRANSNKHRPIVYRVSVSGSTGTLVGSTTFGRLRGPDSGDVSWIQGNTITMDDHLTKLGFWKYPDGGKPTKTVSAFHWGHTGMTVSVAPSH
jgi:hypothetical protein